MSFLFERLSADDFCAAFARLGRGSQFSREALDALYDYLGELADSGGPIEIDPIAICCEWFEADSARDAAAAAEDEDEEHALRRLAAQTDVIPVGAGTRIVVRSF